MRLRLKPQHHLDVKAVDRVLGRVAASDKTLRHQFPRPIKKVISLGGEGLHVTFNPVEELTREKVAHLLQNKYRQQPSEKLVIDQKNIVGFFYGARDTAHIFYTPGAEGFERFTLAHEAGHLFLEFYDKAIAKQQLLFGDEEIFSIAERDPPEHMVLALDEIPASGVRPIRLGRRPTEEIKADGFAAELLAPFVAVQALVSEHPRADYLELVALMQLRFGLSRVAARVRLSDLSEEPTGDQQILPFLGG